MYGMNIAGAINDPLATTVNEHPSWEHSDLHAHLLGCGDNSFWFGTVMRRTLPQKVIYYVQEDDPFPVANAFPCPTFFSESTKTFLSIAEAHARVLLYVENAEAREDSKRDLYIRLKNKEGRSDDE